MPQHAHAESLATTEAEPLVSSTTALALPEELELRPVEGLPRWFGRTLASLFMRLVSMEEQLARGLSSMITPVAGYFRRDRHVHPTIDAATYRLEITGVASPRVIDLDFLRSLPFEERVCVQECAGNGNHIMGSAGLCGQARWRGPSLETVLEACGGPGEATHFAFHGLDRLLIKPGYHYGLSLEELREARALIAVEMNGAPLSRRHGFPARLIVPKVYSMSHVKWLGRIEGKTAPHKGIHNDFVFVNKELQEDGRWAKVQARWIGLKSMISYCRREAGGGWMLTGCAWGGDSPIVRVEVSTDGGATWHDAKVETPAEHFARDQGLQGDDLRGAWAVFSYPWRPVPGEHLIASRATNARGEVQRMDEDPKVRGHFNQTRVKWRRVTVPGG